MRVITVIGVNDNITLTLSMVKASIKAGQPAAQLVFSPPNQLKPLFANHTKKVRNTKLISRYQLSFLTASNILNEKQKAMMSVRVKSIPRTFFLFFIIICFQSGQLQYKVKYFRQQEGHLLKCVRETHVFFFFICWKVILK